MSQKWGQVQSATSNSCRTRRFCVRLPRPRGWVRRTDTITKRAVLALDNVTLEPQVPKNQVYALLSEAEILVAPVKYLPVHRFGVSGNKVLDYMAVARQS